MSGPSTFVPKSALGKWIEARLPIMAFSHASFVAYPTPKNLNYWWTFGAILSFMLTALTSRQVEAIGAAAVLIGLVFTAEGTLLAVRVPWAPYFTIVLTALGIPPELIEIARRPGSGRRYVLLAVNVAILVYLWRRRNEFKTERSP